MSEPDKFEAWWKTLEVYDRALKALAGSAWMEAIKSTQPTPPANQPDPDEWVVQDRVPIRVEIDRCWYMDSHSGLPADPEDMWQKYKKDYFLDRKGHGDYVRDGGGTLHVMCRRRDLPPEQCAACYAPAEPGTVGCKDCNEYAKAICSPEPQKSEDPDEWVILDSVNYANHIPRVGIDEFSTGNGRWQTQKEHHCNGTVAYWKAHEDLIHRCRRRDLPNVEQPEQWPKYYRPVKKATSLLDQKQVAYFRRETRTSGITVHTDGTTFEFNNWEGDLVPIVQITEAEAMALLKKPEPQPAKTRVRLWISAVDGSVYFGKASRLRTDCEIHYDGETKQFYVEEAR